MTDPKTPSPKAPKPSFRWGRLVLFVSLALNLAVAGVVGGAAIGRFGHSRYDLAARDVGFGLFTESLSEKDRKEMRRAYAKAKPDIRADRQEMRENLQRILSAIRADPFDAAVLRAALETGTARVAERQAQGQDVVVTYLAQMSREERAALAERLEKSLKRRSHGKRPSRDDD